MGRIMKNGICYTEVDAMHNYSTDEQIVGTWIDGKTLYEKTVIIQSPQTGYHEYQHGISNIDKVISSIGMAERTDGEFTPIPTTASQQALWGTGLKDINGTRFALELGTSVSYAYCYVTLRYTKSTS